MVPSPWWVMLPNRTPGKLEWQTKFRRETPSSHWIIVAVSNLFSSRDFHYADCHKQALRVSTMWGIESGENHVWIFVSAFTCSTDEWNGKYLKPETLFISSSKTHSEPLWSTGIAAPRVINHSLFRPGFIVWNCPTPALDGRAPRHGALCFLPWSCGHTWRPRVFSKRGSWWLLGMI